jgi:hypothetical protein
MNCRGSRSAVEETIVAFAWDSHDGRRSGREFDTDASRITVRTFPYEEATSFTSCNRADWTRNNASDSYSGDAGFEAVTPTIAIYFWCFFFQSVQINSGIVLFD